MLNRRKCSIRQQVTWLTIIPMLIMTISLETFFLYTRFADLESDLLERGKLIARQLSSSSEYGVFSNNQHFLQNISNGVLEQPDVRGIIILNDASMPIVSAGVIVRSPTDTFPISEAKISNAAGANAAGKSGQEIFSSNNNSSSHGETHIHPFQNGVQIYQPINASLVQLDETDAAPAIRQIGAVIVEMSNENLNKVKDRMLKFSVLATLLFFTCSLYLVQLAGRSVTNPIRELSDAIKRIAKGHLETRVAMSSNVSEFDTLSNGINDMAEQLLQKHTHLQQRIAEATLALREKKEEAEMASEDKSRFLAVASHDLRQPIHALGLYIAELKRKIPGNERQHLVGQIEHSVEVISTLIDSLLDISKLDAGVVVPQKQVCDLAKLLERITMDFQFLARNRNIRLRIHHSHGRIVSDPVLLERILTNLVSNAIRYTPPGGTVLIASRKRGQNWRIEVRDNGVGISKQDHENIFREFIQLPRQQHEERKGLGLGLSIVKRLVKLLDHRIELRSKPGRGSLFAIDVPRTIEPMPQSSAIGLIATEQQPESILFDGEKLLIVDDDVLVLESTASILVSWGYDVTTATSLSVVKSLLSEGGQWNLLITDYQLGNDITGFDVIREVRQYRNIEIPCILISGDTSQELQKRASDGGFHLLHKPVKPAKLRSLVQFFLKEQGKTDVSIEEG